MDGVPSLGALLDVELLLGMLRERRLRLDVLNALQSLGHAELGDGVVEHRDRKRGRVDLLLLLLLVVGRRRGEGGEKRGDVLDMLLRELRR